MSKNEKKEVIEIPKPNYGVIQIKIGGDTPLNIHRLGKKMLQEFEDRDKNKPKPKRQARDYEREFIDSLYFIDSDGCEIPTPDVIPTLKGFKKMGVRIGFPSSAFKKAMVFAARQFDNLKMTELRGRFFVNQFTPFVQIEGVPVLDKFWRRIGGKGPGTGTPDIGIRATVFPWSASLEIRFLKNVISAESVLNLLSTAGFSVGIGEDRPDKSGGTFGTWHIIDGEMK